MIVTASRDATQRTDCAFVSTHGADYNDFVIEPTFFSEGPGNFRDVAQNRRNGESFDRYARRLLHTSRPCEVSDIPALTGALPTHAKM